MPDRPGVGAPQVDGFPAQLQTFHGHPRVQATPMAPEQRLLEGDLRQRPLSIMGYVENHYISVARFCTLTMALICLLVVGSLRLYARHRVSAPC